MTSRAQLPAATAALLACLVLVACSNSAAPGSPNAGRNAAAAAPDPSSPPTVAAGRTAVPAPIDAAELVVRESQPPQYSVAVTSGLPSGCAKFERIDVALDGYVVNVRVWNTLPSDPAVACTMIYGTHVHTVELGGNFMRGESYAVHVNGESRLTFTAQ